MKLDTSNVEYSRNDEKRNIKLPLLMTTELAEIIGILCGDGHLAIKKASKKNYSYCHYELRISGHSIDDYEYFEKVINPLFKRLFNCTLRLKNYRGHELIGILNSKSIVNFFSKVIGLPLGHKGDSLRIPAQITSNSLLIKTSFLRGLADTDFSLHYQKKHKNIHYYPRISGSSKSQQMLKQTAIILNEIGITHSATYNIHQLDKRTNRESTRGLICIYGTRNLEMWMRNIGFHNPKHFTKYLIWKQTGQYHINTSLPDRKKILAQIIESI